MQTVLFTLSESPNANPDASETENAMELLEQSIYSSLRRSDISTRYSNRQIIVILMNTDTVNGDMVAERVKNTFYKLYTKGNICIDYGIARLEGKNQ